MQFQGMGKGRKKGEEAGRGGGKGRLGCSSKDVRVSKCWGKPGKEVKGKAQSTKLALRAQTCCALSFNTSFPGFPQH